MSVVDEIKSRLDIVDLVSETVKLKKSGHSFTGFCPFHSNTRTPSFVVWPESGTWKCFGACNTGGDIFTYVMKRDGLEFREALELLARKAGVQLEARTPETLAQDQQNERLREALAAATTYFHNLLRTSPQGQIARDHLARRGVNDETAVQFQLGYSLDDWHALETFVRNRGFSREEAVSAGLLVQRDDGTVFDRFRGRLMIPIRDAKGHTIGFGARTLTGDEPKYLNSPQSPLFDKGRVLYGLDLARNAIRSAGYAVVVEGYMDALGAHQAGYANVVASMGTALTEAQFRQLARLCKKFILALDPDVAGVQAMLRGLDVARETLDREASPVFDARGLIGYEGHLRVDIRVLVMPGGRDPDEVIRDDPAGWPRLVENALPVVEYVIQTLGAGRNLNDPKEKSAFSRQVVPVIRDVADPVERAHYAQRLARMLRVDERAVLEQLGSAALPKTRRSVETQETAEHKPSDLEAHCLIMFLQSPGSLDMVDETLQSIELAPLGDDDFDHAAHREILSAIRATLELTGPAWPVNTEDNSEYLDQTLWPYLAALAEGASQPASVESPDWEREAVQSALRLRERNLKRQQQELDVLTREALDEDQAEAARELGEQGHRNAIAINRLQKARWPGEIARSSTAEPWRRSAA
jgi:DNA primase